MKENERRELDVIMTKKVEGFWDMFFALCRERELDSSDVYNGTPYDRKYFHKQTKKEAPQRNFVLWMALGLKLNLKEAIDLLAKAGYIFSDKIKEDRIFKFCFEHEIYDKMEVAELLEKYCFSQVSP